MENIKTQKTYADPDLAEIKYIDWLKIIRQLSEQMGLHPVLCNDHKQLLKGRP